MANPTGLNAINAKVWLDTASTPAVDISGWANEVNTGSGDRKIGDNFVFNLDYPIITAGKRGSLEIKFKGLYSGSPATGNPYYQVENAYLAGSASPLYIAWAPQGFAASTGSTGTDKWTSAAGFVKTEPYAHIKADDEKNMLLEFTLIVPYITRTTL